MRRTDLAEDQEYLVSWWATGEGVIKRARLVTLAPLVYGREIPTDATEVNPASPPGLRAPRPGEHVDGVLMEILDPVTGTPLVEGTARLVPVREIRGLWHEVWPAKRTREDALRKDRARAESHVHRLVSRVRALGIAWEPPGYGWWTGKATIDAQTLSALVELAEQGSKRGAKRGATP